uniref:C2H2-type domain-containing protein n=1 Tax=Zea mays TaxID=4577 RepID=C0P964_MAIZE|nr:unknown [Zea mays]ACN31390.1 unknown [Zea mays]
MAPTHAVLAAVDKTAHLGARCPSVLDFQLWRCRHCSPSIESRMRFLCHKRIGHAEASLALDILNTHTSEYASFRGGWVDIRSLNLLLMLFACFLLIYTGRVLRCCCSDACIAPQLLPLCLTDWLIGYLRVVLGVADGEGPMVGEDLDESTGDGDSLLLRHLRVDLPHVHRPLPR